MDAPPQNHQERGKKKQIGKAETKNKKGDPKRLGWVTVSFPCQKKTVGRPPHMHKEKDLQKQYDRLLVKAIKDPVVGCPHPHKLRSKKKETD